MRVARQVDKGGSICRCRRELFADTMIWVVHESNPIRCVEIAALCSAAACVDVGRSDRTLTCLDAWVLGYGEANAEVSIVPENNQDTNRR